MYRLHWKYRPTTFNSKVWLLPFDRHVDYMCAFINNKYLEIPYAYYCLMLDTLHVDPFCLIVTYYIQPMYW